MYRDVWRRSIDEREDFWLDAARGIDWVNPPSTALSQRSATDYSWFADGTLNTSYNALDRHMLVSRGDHAAPISPNCSPCGLLHPVCRVLLSGRGTVVSVSAGRAVRGRPGAARLGRRA
ncbi:acetyl-coenzyme A synthetase N-terminal domain-containing protein [Cryobacterium sp.]|uniref:acetyl-coenzyme A synthetase N-terminal domain-containing protein n=1 Tax=Cryobacterium sp. TaxID=1926290 RepID=UPI002623E576|nr:acetyl-coenzyme A synthetase N-terminal domain-containing protein [Cryobacterium sp.]